jgi:hypothetical protein
MNQHVSDTRFIRKTASKAKRTNEFVKDKQIVFHSTELKE